MLKSFVQWNNVRTIKTESNRNFGWERNKDQFLYVGKFSWNDANLADSKVIFENSLNYKLKDLPSPNQPIHSTYSTKVSKIAWVGLFIGSGSGGSSRSEWIAKHIRIFFFGAIMVWERLKWIVQFKSIRRIQFVDGSFSWIKIITINSTSKYGKHRRTWTQSI